MRTWMNPLVSVVPLVLVGLSGCAANGPAPGSLADIELKARHQAVSQCIRTMAARYPLVPSPAVWDACQSAYFRRGPVTQRVRTGRL